ncbi:MAG: SDH family Clp fold serine proteinase [Terriglobia bacterium]
MIDFSDKIGFKTVTDSIEAPNLDILIHSPGGYAEAAESIVHQLRAKFLDIRFIIPSFAKSAATMLVMSGNEILMDRDAELGPIDPQMRTQNGTSPAEAILEQFRKAQDELKTDPAKLPSWLPILAPLGPSLLIDAQHAIDLSKQMVKNWTKTYMFAGDPEAEAKSTEISKYLGDHSSFKSHARAVKIPDLLSRHVKVVDIRSNPALYKAIDELYCCLDVVLGNFPVYKIFENSIDDALIRQLPQPIMQGLQLPLRLPLPFPVQNPPTPKPPDSTT